MVKKVNNYEQLAELAGVSKATVSLALRNHPKISEQTRNRVQKLAKKHGYRMNPLVAAQMLSVQKGRKANKSITTIGFISPKPLQGMLQDIDTPLKFYYAGIKERAEDLGFTIDYISLLKGDEKNRRLNSILAARGIRGVIIAPLTEEDPLKDFDFDWSHYAIAAIEHAFYKPVLHSVCNDEFETMLRLIDRLKARGFQRIGIAMKEMDDLHVKRHWLAGYHAYTSSLPAKNRLPSFITHKWTRDSFLKWRERHRPQVIICVDDDVYRWLQDAGVRVPDDVGLASVYWLPHRSELSGFYQNHEGMGRAALDLVSSQLYHNDFGLPPVPKKVLIQSVWKEGETLSPD
jgi:LacI family transcriptional regulator